MTYRTAYLDQDNRRWPKGRYCVACNKTLRAGRAYRRVHLVNGGPFVLHPEDEALYVADAGDMGSFPIGDDCARKLGLEWTLAPLSAETEAA